MCSSDLFGSFLLFLSLVVGAQNRASLDVPAALGARRRSDVTVSEIFIFPLWAGTCISERQHQRSLGPRSAYLQRTRMGCAGLGKAWLLVFSCE